MPILAAPPDDMEAASQILYHDTLKDRRERLFELAGDLNLIPSLCTRCGRTIGFRAPDDEGSGVQFLLCRPCGYRQKYT